VWVTVAVAPGQARIAGSNPVTAVPAQAKTASVNPPPMMSVHAAIVVRR
jgi:hypothetical protein